MASNLSPRVPTSSWGPWGLNATGYMSITNTPVAISTSTSSYAENTTWSYTFPNGSVTAYTQPKRTYTYTLVNSYGSTYTTTVPYPIVPATSLSAVASLIVPAAHPIPASPDSSTPASSLTAASSLSVPAAHPIPASPISSTQSVPGSTPRPEASLETPSPHVVLSSTIPSQPTVQPAISTVLTPSMNVVPPQTSNGPGETQPAGQPAQTSDNALGVLLSAAEHSNPSPSETAAQEALGTGPSEILSAGSPVLSSGSQQSQPPIVPGVLTAPLTTNSAGATVAMVDKGSSTNQAALAQSTNAAGQTVAVISGNEGPLSAALTTNAQGQSVAVWNSQPVSAGPVTSAPAVPISVNGAAFTLGPTGANPTGGFVLSGGQTLTPGAPATTINGQTISLAPNGASAVVNGQTQTLAAGPPASPLVLGGQTMTPIGGSAVTVSYTTNAAGSALPMVNGQSLSPGASTVINGQTLNAAPNGQIGVVTTDQAGRPTTSTLLPNAAIPAGISLTTNSAGSTVAVLSGQTLSPGATTVVNGQTLAVSRNGQLGVVTTDQAGHATTSNLLPSAAIPAGVSLTTNAAGSTIAVLSGQTLSPGATTVVNGQTLTVGGNGQLGVVTTDSTGHLTTSTVALGNSTSGFGTLTSTPSSVNVVPSAIISGISPQYTGAAAHEGCKRWGASVVAWLLSAFMVL